MSRFPEKTGRPAAKTNVPDPELTECLVNDPEVGVGAGHAFLATQFAVDRQCLLVHLDRLLQLTARLVHVPEIAVLVSHAFLAPITRFHFQDFKGNVNHCQRGQKTYLEKAKSANLFTTTLSWKSYCQKTIYRTRKNITN